MKIFNAVLVALSALIMYTFIAPGEDPASTSDVKIDEPSQAVTPNRRPTQVAIITDKIPVGQLLDSCRTYIGTPHSLGGLSHEGIDCSGLLFVNFKSFGVEVARSSADQSAQFPGVPMADMAVGDLVFFGSSKEAISHVGIISGVDGYNHPTFIHTSSSVGVVEESLSGEYWTSRIQKIGRPNHEHGDGESAS